MITGCRGLGEDAATLQESPVRREVSTVGVATLPLRHMQRVGGAY